MIKEFQKGWYYEPEQVEEQFKDLKIIYKIGEEPWVNCLAYIPSKNVYLERDVIPRLNSDNYFLSDVYDKTSIQEWKKKAVEKWNQAFPNKKIKEE